MAKSRQFRVRNSSWTAMPSYRRLGRKNSSTEEIDDALARLEEMPIEQKRFAVKAYLQKELAKRQGRL